MYFKLWLEDSVRALDGVMDLDFHNKPKPNDTETPIKRLDTEYLVSLLKNNKLETKSGWSYYPNEVTWGREAGAIRAIVTPKENLHIYRKHYGFKESHWILKKVFKIDSDNYAGRENEIAFDVFEEVKRIDKELLEHIEDTYDFGKLATQLSNCLRMKMKSHVFYYSGLKRVNENQYSIQMNIAGGGQGALRFPRSNRIMRAEVNLSHDVNEGIIRIFYHNLGTGEEASDWEIAPAEFNECFLPSQESKDIIDMILTSLKYY